MNTAGPSAIVPVSGNENENDVVLKSVSCNHGSIFKNKNNHHNIIRMT